MEKLIINGTKITHIRVSEKAVITHDSNPRVTSEAVVGPFSSYIARRVDGHVVSFKIQKRGLALNIVEKGKITEFRRRS